MRRLAQFFALLLAGLSLCYLADTRADDETLASPQYADDGAAPQDKPQGRTEKKSAAPRFVLTLARKRNANNSPIVRRDVPFDTDHFDDFQPVPEPAFSASRPIPKRGSKRTTAPPTAKETLRVVCADVKMSAAADKGKEVSHTVDCSGPVSLDNDDTTIRCSKLHYADGVLTLDDVTICQTGSDAGLLAEVQAQQLTIKFPLESLTIKDAENYSPPKPQRDNRDSFAPYEDPTG